MSCFIIIPRHLRQIMWLHEKIVSPFYMESEYIMLDIYGNQFLRETW